MPPVPPGYRLSLDSSELQFPVIHRYLSRSYWSPGIPREVVEKGMRRLMLATRDAHGLYAKLGWSPVMDPTPFMQIHRQNLYPAQKTEG